jgi:hypothetical protein
MVAEKSVSISFRVSPKFKVLLEAAAAREHRSLTNMLEILLFTYCDQQGLTEMASAAIGSDKNKKGTKE